MEHLVIFTDLDGTLLDFNSYSYEPALPALDLIKKQNIPLIFCTGKTRAEIEVHRKKMHNHHPFISENGGAIFIPNDYFNIDFHYDFEKNGYKIIELGKNYQQLVAALNKIKKDKNVEIRGFFDMAIEEIAKLTGLDYHLASLAKRREYSEPFLTQKIKEIEKEIYSLGFKLTHGGRFHHIIGDNDKGKAVKILTQIFNAQNPNLKIKTIGLGDSLNDLPMLEAVDIPVLVKNKLGEYTEQINLPDLIYADGIGPEGWNDALQMLLK
jgi:mannosyl-3-phosphoglycerate phosphatase